MVIHATEVSTTQGRARDIYSRGCPDLTGQHTALNGGANRHQTVVGFHGLIRAFKSGDRFTSSDTAECGWSRPPHHFIKLAGESFGVLEGLPPPARAQRIDAA